MDDDLMEKYGQITQILFSCQQPSKMLIWGRKKTWLDSLENNKEYFNLAKTHVDMAKLKMGIL